MHFPKVGLITFGDARDHEWINYFRFHTENWHENARKSLEKLPIDLLASGTVARVKDSITAQVDDLIKAGIEVLVAHVPCWTSPNLVVGGIQRAKLPTILLSNRNPSTHGTVGFLAAGGALNQIGFDHLRIREGFDHSEPVFLEEKVMPFIRAASITARLRGKTFGLFGGRSLGIETGLFDPMQWKRMFGIDSEHIDQLEIIRRAELVKEQRVAEMIAWLKDNVATIAYDNKGFTPEKLGFQIRCYIATKEIIQEMGLSFVAIKCMPDLSSHYVPQCITAALLPGPYDAEGKKEPIAMACEADADAGLTMEILKGLSAGGSLFFGDVSYIDHEEKIFYLPNCGAFCTWFAGRSEIPSENLKHVQIRPAMRAGGGGITYFNCAPGPITLARLYRDAGEYKMAILQGEVIRLPEKQVEAFRTARGRHQLPTAFVKVDIDIEQFIDKFGSNHICGMAGFYRQDLEYICRLNHICPVTFDV